MNVFWELIIVICLQFVQILWEVLVVNVKVVIMEMDFLVLRKVLIKLTSFSTIFWSNDY